MINTGRCNNRLVDREDRESSVEFKTKQSEAIEKCARNLLTGGIDVQMCECADVQMKERCAVLLFFNPHICTFAHLHIKKSSYKYHRPLLKHSLSCKISSLHYPYICAGILRLAADGTIPTGADLVGAVH